MTEPKKPLTPAEAKAKRDAFCADLIANPLEYKRLWEEEARREHPEMTDEQHENARKQLAQQFGL